MQYVLLAVVTAGFAVIAVRTWLTLHRDAPVRREIRARDITFRTGVDYVKATEPDSWDRGFGESLMPGWTNQMELIVRGDAFEISSAIPFVRLALNVGYYFRARETSVELSRIVPRIYGSDTEARIVMRGWQAGRRVQLVIARKAGLEDAWNAVVGAGALVDTGWIPPGR